MLTEAGFVGKGDKGGWTSGPTHLLGSGSAKGSGKAGIRSPLNGAISMRQSCSEGSRRGDCSHGGGGDLSC